ncbi:hypothetical protein Syun_025847 [Stephania yunnanensis]|uniref:Uncharacterized protein n=1 Tax=Stephania yunnanensis TaxID=152371 RepID=A0AAP0HV66_9MAGN
MNVPAVDGGLLKPDVVEGTDDEVPYFVEIKRTIPKGSVQPKDFKTKKIFVGGVPTTVSEELLLQARESGGNMIDMVGTQVEIKKAEPKKASNPPPATAFARDSRTRSFGDGIGGYSDSYFGGGDFGPYRTPGLGGRLGGYGGYSGGSELGGGYGGFGGSGLGGNSAHEHGERRGVTVLTSLLIQDGVASDSPAGKSTYSLIREPGEVVKIKYNDVPLLYYTEILSMPEMESETDHLHSVSDSVSDSVAD